MNIEVRKRGYLHSCLEEAVVISENRMSHNLPFYLSMELKGSFRPYVGTKRINAMS